ncbi:MULTISPECIES: hypothetical protein [Bifidobacterium]|uniref:hypothetical protein n=1 Tax=Bifidobacterium TaxID=1678 RepID=UPI001F5DA263|nr:hypothetical protein [Bifidobacterium pseudolongum]
MTPLSKGTGLRTGANRRSTMSGFITKTAAGIAAAATLIGGLAIGASSAQATTTTSYDRTLGNAQFEAARTQNGLAKEMNYGSILHAWMWSFNTMKEHMAEIADAGCRSRPRRSASSRAPCRESSSPRTGITSTSRPVPRSAIRSSVPKTASRP